MSQATLPRPKVAPEPGMMTDRGRVLAVEGARATVWSPDGGVAEAALDDLAVDLTDRATFLLCLDELGRRTGLETQDGFLWYLSGDSPFGGGAWVLEGQDETRTRDADTDDPVESLRRALDETAPEATSG